MPKKPAKDTNPKADNKAEETPNPNPTADERDAVGAKWVKAETE